MKGADCKASATLPPTQWADPRNLSIPLLSLFLLAGCSGLTREQQPPNTEQTRTGCSQAQQALNIAPHADAGLLLQAAEGCLRETNAIAADNLAGRFLDDNPAHPERERGLFLHALSGYQIWQQSEHKTSAQARQAISRFSRLISEFPNTPYSERTRSLVLELRNGMAQLELKALENAQKAGRHQEVLARGDYILTHFGHSPVAPFALKAQIESLQTLGRTQQAKEKKQLLLMRWPDQAKSIGL
jgi:outer membrane assembly lipoprotein YfiO